MLTTGGRLVALVLACGTGVALGLAYGANGELAAVLSASVSAAVVQQSLP
jgi:hypothetical protein